MHHQIILSLISTMGAIRRSVNQKSQLLWRKESKGKVLTDQRDIRLRQFFFKRLLTYVQHTLYMVGIEIALVRQADLQATN